MRLIIPYFIKQKLVYWTARDLTNKHKQKFLYPPNTEKTKFIYNYDNCKHEELVICEGQLNALIVDGIALGGRDISIDQCHLIRGLMPKKTILALDQDSPGRLSINKVCQKLQDYVPNLHYLELPKPTKKDFCDIGVTQTKEWLLAYSKPWNPQNSLESQIRIGLEI